MKDEKEPRDNRHIEESVLYYLAGICSDGHDKDGIFLDGEQNWTQNEIDYAKTVFEIWGLRLGKRLEEIKL